MMTVLLKAVSKEDLIAAVDFQKLRRLIFTEHQTEPLIDRLQLPILLRNCNILIHIRQMLKIDVPSHVDKQFASSSVPLNSSHSSTLHNLLDHQIRSHNRGLTQPGINLTDIRQPASAVQCQ